MRMLAVAFAAAALVAASAPARGQNGAPADSAAVPVGGRPIGLAEALAIARDRAPAVVRSRGQLDVSRAQVRSSYAAFLPSLSLTAGATRQFTSDRTRIENGQIITVPTTPWSYNAGLGASLELFEGGRRFLELRQANAAVDAAEASVLSERYQVDLEVKRQFFAALAARESEQAARAQVEQAEQQRREAVLRVRAGNATKSDSLRSEIQLSNARLARAQALVDLAAAGAALTRAIGAAEPVTAAPAELADDPPGGLDEDVLRPLAESGPLVRQAEAELAAARAARTTVWTDYLPSLTASYNRGGSGSGDGPWFGADDLSYAGSLRLSMSLPVFDRLGREEQGVRAAVAQRNAEAALADARLAARETLTRTLGAYRIALQRVQAQTASVAAAEEDLRVQRRRYAVGGGTLLDVLTSQTLLDQAREALIRARYDQRIARAQLEALVGRELQ